MFAVLTARLKAIVLTKAPAVLRARWMWIVLGIALGLGLAELRALIAPSYNPALPSMKQPERLLAFLVQPDPPVRNVVFYPLENAYDFTQLTTFDLWDEQSGVWTAHKAWVDIPVTAKEHTLQEYAAAMRRQGTLRVAARGPGLREAYAMSTLIVLLATLTTSAAGPRVIETFRALKAARAEPRAKQAAAAALVAQTATPEPSPPKAGDETHEFTETAPPPDIGPAQAPEEGKDYAGEWYPVARTKQRHLGQN